MRPAEGRGHHSEDAARRLRRKLPCRLQAERGDGDEGAAEQHAGKKRPGETLDDNAGGDADHLDQTTHGVSRIEPNPGGELLPEPGRGETGKAGDHPDGGLENAPAAALANDGDQEGGRHHIAEAEQPVGKDHLRQRSVLRQRRFRPIDAVGWRGGAREQRDKEQADSRNRTRP